MSISTLTAPVGPSVSRTAATVEDGTTGRVTWKRGLATGLVAAVAVTLVAVAFRAAGHPLSVGGSAIPILGFAQMVLLSTVVGVLAARHTSRTTFYRLAGALTVLSCMPDVALGDSLLSTAGLVLTHVIAAVIIVPRIARR